jgi:hypothetical protein
MLCCARCDAHCVVMSSMCCAQCAALNVLRSLCCARCAALTVMCSLCCAHCDDIVLTVLCSIGAASRALVVSRLDRKKSKGRFARTCIIIDVSRIG